MPDKPNPFSAWSTGDQANIRQQLLDQLHTGQLNPAQRTGVLNALVASNPQAGTSTFSLATGVPLTPGGIAGGVATSAGRGLWDLAQGILGLADPNQTPLEKQLMRYPGARYSLIPIERMVKGTAQGLSGLPQVPAAMRDMYQSGPTGLGAAAMTEGPRLGAQVAASELLARAPGMASKLIPSEIRAGRGFDHVEGRIGNQPLQAGKSPQAAFKLYDRIQLTGRMSIPRPVARFLDRVTSPGGISFQDARNFYTDINSLIHDDEALPPRERKVPSQFMGPLKDLAHDLGQDLKTTANQYGLGNIYDASLREFARAQKYRSRMRALGRPVGAVTGGAAGWELGSLTGIPHLGWMGSGIGGTAGAFYGTQAADALANLALRRGAGGGYPGVPSPLSTIARGLAYGGAAAGAGRSLPSTTQPTPTLPGQPGGAQTAQAQMYQARRRDLPAEFRDQPVIQLPPQDIDRVVYKSAFDTGLDPRLIHAMRGRESGGFPGAVSDKKAMGDMQLMPDTARDLGVRNPFDPRENIPAGARYMRDMLARYKGNVPLALAAYNAGSKAVDKYGGIPPYPQTQNYVRVIMARYQAALQGGQATAKPPAAISPVATGPAFGIPGQPPAPMRFGQP